ncbi:MAG: helix-turn-helix domain-containing protein [Fusobacteriaceae bacterium]
MFVEMVDFILKEKGISRSELARRLNIKRQSVYGTLKYYADGRTPSFKTMKKWSIALEVDIKIFLSSL